MDLKNGLWLYWEAPERRATRSKTDVPGRRGIWVGRSTVVSGGHKVVPIEHNKGQWTLGPTIHRSYVKPMNTKFPLSTAPAKGADPSKYEEFIDIQSNCTYKT